MKQNPIRERLLEFVEAQTAERFLSLREAVLASPTYSPYSDALDRATELVEAERFREAYDHLRSLRHACVLTPRYHFLLAAACEKVGDAETARMETSLGRMFLEGILTTGDGSEEKPYLVSRTEDEYDLLMYAGKESQGQELVRKGDRAFDHHRCGDGTSVWFDVTAPLSHLGRSLQSGDAGRKPWWKIW